MPIQTIITGSGKYIPNRIIKNSHFLKNTFLQESGEPLLKSNQEITDKLQEITEIEERRYLEKELNTSDMAYYASLEAIKDAAIDPETLDYIICTHNFGDIKHDNLKSDLIPTLASRVKHLLQIENPYCVAYDLLQGCPGWIQGIIQSNCLIRSGEAQKVLVIGAESLSRIADPHDIDSMIYSDGAGAVVVEAIDAEEKLGILCHKTRTDTISQAYFLQMDVSFNPLYGDNTLFMKMNGRKLYEYALTNVPPLVKEVIDNAGLSIHDIKKVLIHQANGKMDRAILQRVFKLYDEIDFPDDIMPMSISKLGNNSVATIPILYDMIKKGELTGHRINSGDYLLFVSVGAGMNVNAFIYLVP